MRSLALGLCALILPCAAYDFPALEGRRIFLPELIDVLESWRDADPDAAVNYHSLGLVYYLAAAQKAWMFKVETNDERAPFYLPDLVRRGQDGSIEWHPPRPRHPAEAVPRKGSDDNFVYCVERAVRNFEEAVERAPNESRYWLSYAAILEDIWSRAFGKDMALFPAEFQKVRVPSLRHAYAKALALAIAAEKNQANNPLLFEKHAAMEIAFEAAQALVRLEKARNVSAGEKPALDDARAALSRLTKEVERLRRWRAPD